jgi:Uncharacterized conserved protein
MRIFGKAVIMENDSVDKIVFEKYPNLKEMYNTEHKQKLGHFYISEGVANLPTDFWNCNNKILRNESRIAKMYQIRLSSLAIRQASIELFT